MAEFNVLCDMALASLDGAEIIRAAAMEEAAQACEARAEQHAINYDNGKELLDAYYATAAPHIARLELRKAQLETLLAQAGTAVAPVALHTATAKRFAADMAALGQAITEAQAEGDATLTAALRTMVTTVTVHRNYELEITGNLAPLTRGEEMVAGERLDCFPPATLVIPFIITAAA